MKAKFTCARCGKENIFDTEKVRKICNLMERAGSASQLVAYSPTCRYGGEKNRVEPRPPKGKPRMSSKPKPIPPKTNRAAQRPAPKPPPEGSKNWQTLAAE